MEKKPAKDPSKMNPQFLVKSHISGLATFAALYSFRKENKLSEKALLILLYLIDAELLDVMVGTVEIGEKLGETQRSNLSKAIKALSVAGMVADDETEREGSRYVRRIRIASDNNEVASLLRILDVN